MTVLLLLAAALALFLFMTGAWAAQRFTGQSGWVDTIWSFSVGLVGAALALAPAAGASGPSARQILAAALVLAWSLRLGAHIAARTLRGGEDPRYAALAREWGSDFSRRLFYFLQIQAAAAFLLVVAVFAAARNPAAFPGVGDVVGLIVLVVAVVGEAIADRQLEGFRTDPRNRGMICQSGLWSLSRHPNYFFEWLGWLAYPVIAIGLPPDNLVGLVALLGPILMYWLLVHVSGIPPLEAHMRRSRGAAFNVYCSRVSAFFPWPPKTIVSPIERPPS